MSSPQSLHILSLHEEDNTRAVHSHGTCLANLQKWDILTRTRAWGFSSLGVFSVLERPGHVGEASRETWVEVPLVWVLQGVLVARGSFHVIGHYYQLYQSKNGFQKRSSHPLCCRTLDLDVRDLIECCHLAKVFKISHCLRKLEKLKTSYCSHIEDIWWSFSKWDNLEVYSPLAMKTGEGRG